MQDGAPCHKSKASMAFLAENRLHVLPWPGNSPDINLIENLWNQMKRKVEELQPGNLKELKTTIATVWATKTTLEECQKLARSMPRRIQAVLAAGGGHTKY